MYASFLHYYYAPVHKDKFLVRGNSQYLSLKVFLLLLYSVLQMYIDTSPSHGWNKVGSVQLSRMSLLFVELRFHSTYLTAKWPKPDNTHVYEARSVRHGLSRLEQKNSEPWPNLNEHIWVELKHRLMYIVHFVHLLPLIYLYSLFRNH